MERNTPEGNRSDWSISRELDDLAVNERYRAVVVEDGNGARSGDGEMQRRKRTKFRFGLDADLLVDIAGGLLLLRHFPLWREHQREHSDSAIRNSNELFRSADVCELEECDAADFGGFETDCGVVCAVESVDEQFRSGRTSDELSRLRNCRTPDNVSGEYTDKTARG